jgi:hypothetical protein
MGVEIDQLVAIVQKFMSVRRLGEYDGYEVFSSETRIRLYTCDAPALAAAILPVLRALRVYECTTVRTSENVLGGDWRDVAR